MVLVALLPAVRDVARAARSVEKLADVLRRELPPTLASIRLTGMEIGELTDDVSDGMKSAGRVVKQVDEGISSAKQQAKKVSTTTRGVMAGMKAAWKTLKGDSTPVQRSYTPELPEAEEPRAAIPTEAAIADPIEPPTDKATARNGQFDDSVREVSQPMERASRIEPPERSQPRSDFDR